jgi:hypothetical protein
MDADGPCGPLDLRWVEGLLPVFSADDHPDQLSSQLEHADSTAISDPASERRLNTKASNVQSVQALAEAVRTH